MIEEAISRAVEIGQELAYKEGAKIVTVPGDGRSVLIEHKGELIDRLVPPPLRKHSVTTLDAVIKAAERWGGDKQSVVWVNEQHVMLVPDDRDRRETVTLQLSQTTLFKEIKTLATKNLDQAALVRLLRTSFRKAVKVAEMLTAVRKIKFRSSAEGFSTVLHGNESMGNSIENEVTGAAELPTLLVVPATVFVNGATDEPLFEFGLDLEIDTKGQKFLLRPMADDMEAAIARAIESICEKLAETLPGVTILAGSQ